ncbi:cytochrome b/b6 domain-containing protein [Aminobacter sp. J44]|uniref:cytochrome b/b6 domain-containing protein n=1 Tax=Aminobacter sp. J44 TaxID=935262 RepID=UPI00119B0F3A|nr:cytochrome b/b6 domain-containing protein [Aminobacter sp. J44]TWG64773.1 cytochrome b561 [Aminobacter sp. J44]
MSVRDSTQGYSATQIMLHWTVALLVAFQFFLNQGIGDAFRAVMSGEEPTADAVDAANIHVTMGLLILMLALWRIGLRLTLGAPPAPTTSSSCCCSLWLFSTLPARWCSTSSSARTS